MGSPVSAVFANLYMEFFEELALQSAPSSPRLWKQYVDDTCCIDEVEFMLNYQHHQVHHGAGEGWCPSLPRHQANMKGRQYPGL